MHLVYLYRHLILARLLVMKGELLGTTLSCLDTWDGSGRHQKVPNTSVHGEMSIPFSLALVSGSETLERSPNYQDPNSCSS